MSDQLNPYKEDFDPGKPKESVVEGIPSIQDPREPRLESNGEAAVRIGEWVIMILSFIKVKVYPQEKDAVYTLVGAFLRTYPGFRKRRIFK